MNKTLLILMAVIAGLCGCTRNDGDIGPLFGIWQMTERRVAGIEIPDRLPPTEELFWAFQSSVVEMKRVYSTSYKESIYGNWELDGSTLRLDFPDPDQPMLEEFLLPRQCEVEIRELDGKNLHIVWHPADGGEVSYKFRKR